MNATIAQYARNDIPLALASLPECELLEAARRGEEWGFSELLRRHSRRIYLTIHRITQNKEDAEDVLQIAFLNAFKNLKQFDSRAQFSTWLTRIAMNSALMLLRKRRAAREIAMVVPGGEGDAPCEWELEDSADGPERQCLRSEMDHQLRFAITQLPASFRTLTQVYLAEGKSTKELAAMFGLSMAATKSRMVRARRMLRSNIASMQSNSAPDMQHPCGRRY